MKANQDHDLRHRKNASISNIKQYWAFLNLNHVRWKGVASVPASSIVGSTHHPTTSALHIQLELSITSSHELGKLSDNNDDNHA